MSEAQSKNSNLALDTQLTSKTAQIVVTCPSCSTKFSILKEIVENLSSPRFHCARCENIFTVSELTEEINLTKREHVFKSLPEKEEVVVPKRPLPTIEEPQQIIEKETQHKTYEIPTGFVESVNVTAPREIFGEEEEIKTKKSKNNSWGKKKTNQLAFDFENQKIKTSQTKITRIAPKTLVSKSNNVNSSNFSTTSNQKLAPNPLEYDEDFSFTDSLKINISKLFNFKLPKIKWHNSLNTSWFLNNSWKDFLYIASPLLIFLSFLFCLSLIFTNFPNSAKTFTKLLAGSSTEVAPVGVYINNLRHQKIILDSGDEAHLISGKIINSSDQKLKGLKIQGLGLSSTGTPVLSAIVPFQGTLAKAKTKSLTPKMINEIQRNSKSVSVSPGGKEDFTIALVKNSNYLTGSNTKDVSYYSARVYSVLN